MAAQSNASSPAVPRDLVAEALAAAPPSSRDAETTATDKRISASEVCATEVGEVCAPTVDEAMAMLSGFGSAAANRRAAIEEKRREAAKKRKELTRDLRNEDRKRQRVIQKARGLTEEDLLELLGSKARAKAKSKSAAIAKGTAKGQGESKAVGKGVSGDGGST